MTRDSERVPVFRSEVVHEGEVITVRVYGELDLVTAERLDETLAELQQAGANYIVVDLRDLDFMDSTGLKVLLRWDKLARADGFRLGVIRGTNGIQRLFELTRLERHFDFVDP